MTDAELEQAARELIDDLVELRHTRGITQTQVATRMRTSASNVSSYENHRRTPGITVLLKYADAIGADITFITRRSRR